MKTSVLDSRQSPLFEKSDFDGISGTNSLELLRLDGTGDFSGRTFAQIPPDTTHLITWFADRLKCIGIDANFRQYHRFSQPILLYQPINPTAFREEALQAHCADISFSMVRCCRQHG